jgi:LacI family purine nucleotide synthesis repressor
MKESGIDVSDKKVVYEYNPEDFIKKTLKVLSSKERPSAFFCPGETSAMLCLRCAHYLNIKVPDELSVISYGGSMLSRFSTPELTTVSQPFQAMGEEVVRSLIADIRLPNMRSLTEAIEIILPTQLKIKSTTAIISKQGKQANGK